MALAASRRSGGGSLRQTVPSCNACGKQKVGLRICPCEKAYYCGAACQQKDWPAHAAICRHGRPSETPETTCAGCDNVSRENAWCQCATVLYCSRECQLKHWAAGHKTECTPFYKHQQQTAARQDSLAEAGPQDRFLALLDQLKREPEAAA